MKTATPVADSRRATPVTATEWEEHSQTEFNHRIKEVQATHKRTKVEKIHYVEAEPLNEDEEIFRHSGWKEKRGRVRHALAAAGTSPTSLNAYDNCGAECAIQYSDSLERWRVLGSYCKCRHCEPCMRAKGTKIATNLQSKIQDQPNAKFRFITLTLKHTTVPLADQLKRLYASFRKLRQWSEWKHSQKGGAATLEVKWSPITRQWHPHLHVISDGNFLHTRALSEKWLQITGDSKIVDIRPLNSAKDAAFYVAKYMSKGTSNEVWHDEAAANEWITATRGLRVCMTYGTWRGFKLLANPSAATDWRTITSLSDAIRRARRGERAMAELLIKIRHPHYTHEAMRQAGLFEPPPP